MKCATLAVLVASVFCAPVFAADKDNEYQKGTIIAVEKLPPKDAGASARSDAPPNPDVYRWDVSVQVGDTIYKARWKRYDPSSLGWIKGKEVQVRPKGNVMYLKREDGSVLQGSIVGKSKAQQ